MCSLPRLALAAGVPLLERWERLSVLFVSLPGAAAVQLCFSAGRIWRGARLRLLCLTVPERGSPVMGAGIAPPPRRRSFPASFSSDLFRSLHRSQSDPQMLVPKCPVARFLRLEFNVKLIDMSRMPRKKGVPAWGWLSPQLGSFGPAEVCQSPATPAWTCGARDWPNGRPIE